MKIKISILFFAMLLFITCKKDNNPSDEWLIPAGEVQDGGPGKDGIPSVDNPLFITVSEVDFLDDDDLIVGMIHNGVIKAYPHPILDWHEIVNDAIDDRNVALTYCPLTGTAIAWNRTIDGKTTTFGVSGKLYNNNLLPYDRETDSYWSQAKLSCVNGERIGKAAETFPIIETNWKSWKTMYPNSLVMSTETGFSRNYNNYPYGDYRTNNGYIIFPLKPEDTRLPAKERVLGILNGSINKVYSINLFETPQVIYDTVGGDDFIIIGSKADNFIIGFSNNGLGDLTIDLSNFPVIATDESGNALEISGEVSAGPLAGTQLEMPVSFIGYWFAFGAFYPNIDIY